MARKKRDIVVSNETKETLDTKVEETPQPGAEVSKEAEEVLDSKVEETPQPDIEVASETVPEEGQATQEELLDTHNSPDQDPEPETQNDSEESTTSEKEGEDLENEPEVNLDYTEDLGIVDGEVYVVKCNKFISNKLSRYEVRISTANGFRKYKKTSRDKACYLANQMNRARGIINNLKIVE